MTVRRLAVVACGLVTSSLVGVLHLFRPAILGHLDRRVLGHYLRAGPGIRTSGRVIIVDIDEHSLIRIGRWPRPRDPVALGYPAPGRKHP